MIQFGKRKSNEIVEFNGFHADLTYVRCEKLILFLSRALLTSDAQFDDVARATHRVCAHTHVSTVNQTIVMQRRKFIATDSSVSLMRKRQQKT